MKFSAFLAEEEVNEKAKLDAFMKDFWSQTNPHPFDDRIRLKDYVGVECRPWDGMIHISSIISFLKKNAGEATKALDWFVKLADKHKVTLDLTAKPIANAGAKEGKSLNKSQLLAWYKRKGFVQVRGDELQRKPQ